MFLYVPQVYPPSIGVTPGCARKAEEKSQCRRHKVALFDAVFQGLLALQAHLDVESVGFFWFVQGLLGRHPLDGREL